MQLAPKTSECYEGISGMEAKAPGMLLMDKEIILPEIVPSFHSKQGVLHHHYYSDLIRRTLLKILPQGLFVIDPEHPEDLQDHFTQFEKLLPFFTTSTLNENERDLSFYLVQKYRSNAFRFFFEMVSNWLVPAERLNVVLLYAVDFQMPTCSWDRLTLCEVMVSVKDQAQWNLIKKNLPVIMKEVRLGADSSYKARKILEFRGLSIEEKTALVHQHISDVIKSRPQDFSQDIFNDVPQLLVLCPNKFKEQRRSHVLSRIICIYYLFKKSLKEAIKKSPKKRHLSLKISKMRIENKEGFKNVLSFMVGVNFLNPNEVFEEKHLLKAIRNYVPNVQSLEDSFLCYTDQDDPIAVLYLEIEKNDRSEFSSSEIRRLRSDLPTDIKDRIEHLMHPVFMPRNEEEVMRNILVLSKQLNFTRDLPQVMITFDKQSSHFLTFTVIILRVIKKEAIPIQEAFKGNKILRKIVFEQVKTVGLLRKKYPKEANVLEVSISKAAFLRDDHSIDLFKARKRVGEGLVVAIGEFRDFNGGMITKQHEAFSTLSERLKDKVKTHGFLLENFYYSIQPSVMRNILPPDLLKDFFLLLLNALEDNFFKNQEESFFVRTTNQAAFAIFTFSDLDIKGEVDSRLNAKHKHYNLASTFVHVSDTPCFGYLLKSESVKEKEKFLELLQGIFNEKKNKLKLAR